MALSVMHNCHECAAKKEILDIKVDEEDIEEYEDIRAGLNTANDMMSQYTQVEKPVNEKVLRAALDVVHQKESEYKLKEQKWWRRILKKYNISEQTKIDINRDCFYVCLLNGSEIIDFVPKQVDNIRQFPAKGKEETPPSPEGDEPETV
jgi:hypothetical protein